jgi:hypothetical protein
VGLLLQIRTPGSQRSSDRGLAYGAVSAAGVDWVLAARHRGGAGKHPGGSGLDLHRPIPSGCGHGPAIRASYYANYRFGAPLVMVCQKDAHFCAYQMDFGGDGWLG